MFGRSSVSSDEKVKQILTSNSTEQKSTLALPEKGKGKGKVHHRSGHEGPDGEQKYSFTLSVTSAQLGWVFNATPRPLYLRERAGIHCIGGGVGPGPVWTVAENLARNGTQSPDRPARSESLYRLSYPGPRKKLYYYYYYYYYYYLRAFDYHCGHLIKL